ncbi:hypothetical protein TWF696_004078 [Orbilia brochopaga]|uniref:MACPF domain-containing protein n=1 Tax=Orbilia brochopaga TaxID=3140254 RepID=A0AAV9V7Y6_9PEZI
MDLEDILPVDPLVPTVEYVGASQTPFTVPWAKGRVQLCTGFNSRRAQHDDLFIDRAAFQDTASAPLRYRECQITSIRDESGTDIANSSENRSFAIGASVGGSFLGASARGSYEKNVRDNRNTSNISVRADHVCGQIEVVQVPQLAKAAVRLLNTSADPIKEFRQMYGDFYVAGFRVGAVNSTIVSGKLANKSFFEAKRAEVKVKVLFATIHKSVNDVSSSASDEGGLNVAAFDSLTGFYSNFTARTYEDSLQAGEVASANKQRAMTIAARAADVLWKEFSMGGDQSACIYQNVVDRLCDRGLVTELLLAPFATLREYQSVVSRRLSFSRH